ncbi:hypothetical protein IWW39_004080 [Coemansia spiralis]|uniref:PhoD-like phosphatase metallophosphatase domain-containing protein n=1 Tax=Coemansia spiralis TaxID=417178 RepID=A0A9W8L3N5_9FUNG|nr:hypothetical protein IWW39_004080 [Coemansia spiralis]
MNIVNAASALHLLFSASLLWVVPSQHLFLADMVAFPVSLFLLVREIASKWSIATAIERLRRHSIEICIDDAQSESSSRESSISGAVNRRIKYHEHLDLSQYKPLPEKAAVLLTKASRDGHKRLSLFNALLLLADLVMFIMCLDFVYRPLLTPGLDLFIFRPGHVSHNSAKLHIRYPDGGDLELRYKELGSDWIPARNVPWESAGVFEPPTNATDFTMTTALMNLQPSTKYIVALHCRQPTLHSQTALLSSLEFKTAPIPGDPAHLRFATGSCIKPNFPYRPTLSPDIRGFASILDHSDDLDMVVFLGDFIYADLPLYFGSTVEDYRRLYRQVYRTKLAHRLVRKVPMIHVYDDHEIMNNWHAGDAPPMGSALAAYNEYNGLANPPSPTNRAYYNFTYGDIAFYAWDTRRYRSRWETENEVGRSRATMLGKEQKVHFTQWLAAANHTAAVKFVISSVPLTFGWSNEDSSQDTWRGYPTERAEILELTRHVPNLFFLSGDRHEMAAVELPSGNMEFSTSPISQFTFPLVGQFRANMTGETTLHHRRPGHVKYGILDVDTRSGPVPRVTYNLYTTDVHQGKQPAWTYEAKCSAWR